VTLRGVSIFARPWPQQAQSRYVQPQVEGQLWFWPKGEKSLRENWITVRFVVEAPAFMRGKERLSAPEKNLDFDHAL
jgi:hypothetical protein